MGLTVKKVIKHQVGKPRTTMADEVDHQQEGVLLNNAVEEGIIRQEVHLIQDLEGWLLLNGLRGPDNDDQLDQGEFELAEQRQRLEEESNYTRQIHERIFRDAVREAERKQQMRRDFLDSLNDLPIDLTAADGTVTGVSLRKLAETCDTIYTLAGTWDNFSQDNKHMRFSLDGCSKACVEEFLSVLLDESKSAIDISAGSIVDCCLLAHYLCADELLKDITELLVASVDTSNCLSLCQLADRLNLPVLFERALAHMMDTIGDLERTETWDDFTPELRERVAAIKAAIESSVNCQSRLYFVSLEEYIAIFAERVQYFRERLAEAKEQHGETQPGTRAWCDAKSKIDRQETRVRTLEIALREHKKLFKAPPYRLTVMQESSVAT